MVRSLLGKVVVNGTAKHSNFGGYSIGGKTGTAEKPDPVNGGYYENKVISTFASVFPISTGDYVLVVTLDEPENNLGSESFRYASKTAVPISAKIISRIAPLLGLKLEKNLILIKGPMTLIYFMLLFRVHHLLYIKILIRCIY